MTKKPKTPTPVADPEGQPEQSTWVTSLYYTKVSADVIAREIEAFNDRVDGRGTPPSSH